MWPCEHRTATRAAHEDLVVASEVEFATTLARKAISAALTVVRRPDGGCHEGYAFPGHPLFARLGTSLMAGSPVLFGWARLLRVEPIEDLG
jgi:hypothetical protein